MTTAPKSRDAIAVLAPRPMFEDSPVFQMACRQLEAVAGAVELDPGVLERLSQPKRALVVSVPIHMDDGRTESFVGYRVQHSLTSGLRFFRKDLGMNQTGTLRHAITMGLRELFTDGTLAAGAVLVTN